MLATKLTDIQLITLISADRLSRCWTCWQHGSLAVKQLHMYIYTHICMHRSRKCQKNYTILAAVGAVVALPHLTNVPHATPTRINHCAPVGLHTCLVDSINIYTFFQRPFNCHRCMILLTNESMFMVHTYVRTHTYIFVFM